MITSRVDAVKGIIERRTLMALQEAAQTVAQLSFQRTPFQDGALRNSLALSYARTGTLLQAVVSYNIIYAARQHEETGWHHNVGQAKFLSSAVDDSQATIRQIFRNHLGASS